MTLSRFARPLAVGVAVLPLLLASAPAQVAAQQAAADATPGGSGSGDPLFPAQGNGGYNVAHYGIRLAWKRPNEIRAVATVRSRATKALSAFNLDLHALQVQRIEVDGKRAGFQRMGDELTVRPKNAIRDGAFFVTRVEYHGTPRTITDPDGSPDGWIKTPDGATVLSEPIGAMSWFPCNNTPRDKATYDIRVRAPNDLKVASNGALTDVTRNKSTRTWHWRSTSPMATYLALVSIGRYDVIRGKTASGIPLRSYIDPSIGGSDLAKRIPGVLKYWERLFGPYPFGAGGIVIDNVPVGYALEVQTRPVFPSRPGMPTFVHEFAHQWFGDSVTPVRWSDIWLNEGFATYAEWLWTERHHPGAALSSFRDQYDGHGPGDSFWNGAVGDPGDGSQLFNNRVYTRGAMALEALRLTIGRADFFELLRAWPREHQHGNATTAQLQTLAEQISGQSLDQLFDDWVRNEGKPPGF